MSTGGVFCFMVDSIKLLFIAESIVIPGFVPWSNQYNFIWDECSGNIQDSFGPKFAGDIYIFCLEAFFPVS